MFYTRGFAPGFLCPHLIGNITKVFYPLEREQIGIRTAKPSRAAQYGCDHSLIQYS